MDRGADERSGADWARAADGIGLAGIAVFLLLNTTGYLPWSFWLDAIALWPVLIMSAGVKIAFEKSRAPWLVLLGPVFVLGSLGWLASGRRPDAPVGPWEAALVDRGAGIERVDFEAALAGAKLRLVIDDSVPAGRLVDGRSIARQASARLESHTKDGVAELRLNGGSKHRVVFLPRPSERWDLRLPAELPLRVRLRGAGIGGVLDLTAGTLERARAEGVFIGVEVRLPAPSRDTEIQMNGVFNSLTVVVPEGTPVRVHGPGLPFNAVDRGVRGAEGRPGYDVSVQGVFSAVEVFTDGKLPREPRPPRVPGAEPPGASPSPPPPAEAPPSPAGRVS